MKYPVLAVAISFLIPFTPGVGQEKGWASHPPIRPLPSANADRTMPGDGAPVFFVDGISGSDSAEGSKTNPWRSISHGVAKMKPGDFLLIRGGTYHEHVEITSRGTKQSPVTVSAFPGEQVIIDGGIPDFSDAHSIDSAWEPLANGEYRSTKSFPGLGTVAEGRTNLLGNFADSMIPLHGYRFRSDLQSNNHLFNKLDGPKTEKGTGLYCGPGVFYDVETGRIHIRLAHTRQPSIGSGNNYAGETDPRMLPLIIAGPGPSPLSLAGAAHVVLRDLVVRGAREATIDLDDSSNITLDGVTSYGGSSALRIQSTSGLRCVNCAFRGIAAPWLWRWSLKYRSIEARIVAASSWNPPARYNRDFEFAFCEFTDSVDGVFIGGVEDCRIHHCFLDDVSDDGFFLTCGTRMDGTVTGSAKIYQNRISDTLSAFAFGVGHGRQKTIDEAGNKLLGGGVEARKNVFDLRGTVLYQEPESGPILTYGRISGDHGGPTWEPIRFEQNTVYSHDSPWRSYYGAGLGKAMGKGTNRQIIANLFIHETGMPGDVFPQSRVDLETRGNVNWSNEAGAGGADQFLKRFKSSPLFSETGWGGDDLYLSPDRAPSGAGAGEDHPVGQFGRLTLYGKETSTPPKNPGIDPFLHDPREAPSQKAALVLGYPAFDAPMVQFAMEKSGLKVDVFEQNWLPAERYSEYRVVAILGSTLRAKMEHSGFSEAELELLKSYLAQGGSLIVGRELIEMLFPGDPGRKFIDTLCGNGTRSREKPQVILLDPKHPWLAHLDSGKWSPPPAASPIKAVARGKNLIGDPDKQMSLLADIPVGRGHFVYVGWDLSRYTPSGRKPSTLEDERAYESQYQIYEAMIRDL